MIYQLLLGTDKGQREFTHDSPIITWDKQSHKGQCLGIHSNPSQTTLSLRSSYIESVKVIRQLINIIERDPNFEDSSYKTDS